MNEATRHALLATFDKSRASFLASLDQIVAEVRPALLEVPGYYDGSVLACASAFASRELVRSQLEDISPDLLKDVADEDLNEAHLTTVAYLFSLMLHEAIRNDRALPAVDDPTREESTDA